MIVLITGVMAAGKSTIAQALAQRLEKSIHLRGDVFRRMIVNGGIAMSATADPDAVEQLHLRYHAAAKTAILYSQAGFNVVYQDTIIGSVLEDVVRLYDKIPIHIVVLNPRAQIVSDREQSRAKTGYKGFSVEQLQEVLHTTPKIGYWLDNSDLSVDETVDEIMAHLSTSVRVNTKS